MEGCIDWRWHYKYNILHLMIVEIYSNFDTVMIEPNDHTMLVRMFAILCASN